MYHHSRSTLRRAPLAVATVAAVAAGLITAGPAAFADPASTSSAPDQAGQDPGVLTLDGIDQGPKTITLITGDTVTLTNTGNGSGGYSIDVDAAVRPDGHIPLFVGTGDEDAFYLYPDDARPAVESGVLDRDLFNLTYLAENGYTDAEVDSLPVIAQYPQTRSTRSLDASAEALPGSAAVAELSSIHSSGLTVPKDDAGAFWSAIAPTMAGPGLRPSALPTGISKLWLDHRVSVSLDESVPMIGAPDAWDVGLDGTGVTVAVLDTGYDENHPDLAGKVIDAKSFVLGLPSTHDGHGHGTHVASTIAGSGAASDGRYKGVAPGVDLIIGKALLDSGHGLTSWMIDGMEWAAHSGADVISMSVGATPTPGDPAAQALDELTASTGALFVVAAGNDGPAESTIDSPGIADSALTVAAVDKSDQLASFSSRGPRSDGALKPDIAAPGVDITAARSAGTDMGGGATVVNEFYDTASGTSMATPHVSGAAAILVQEHPDWTPAELKNALMGSSVDDGYSVYEQGAGRVDIARAIDQAVFATTANVNFEVVPDGAGPLTQRITYRNTGTTDVTLTLTPNLRQVSGEPAPDGALSADGTVTVPAGGTATATVTLDGADLAVGTYTGAIVANDEATGTRLRTPVGFRRQPPMHNLTINVLGRDGQPATPMNSVIRAVDVTFQLGDFASLGRWVSTGVFETRVPEGVNSVTAPFQWVDESRRNDFGYLIAPEVEVTGDTEITLDARELQRFSFTTTRPAEVPAQGGNIQMWFQRTLAQGWRVVDAGFGAPFNQLWMTPTEPVRVGDTQAYAAMTLAAPEVALRVRGAPDLALHPMTWPHEGTRFKEDFTGELFTGTKTLRLADAGLGRPEDIAGRDLAGSLALLDVDSGCGVPIDRLHNLRDAGAAGVLVWPSGELDRSGCLNGPIIPMGPSLTLDDRDSNIGIPYASIAPGEARALLDRLDHRTVRITMTGTPDSPYLYEATPFEFGQVPDSLTYDLTDRHVARVDTEYHATEPMKFVRSWTVYTTNTFLPADVTPPVVNGPGGQRLYVGPLSDQVIHNRKVFASDGAAFFKIDVFDEPIRTHATWNGAAAVMGSTTFGGANLGDPATPLGLVGSGPRWTGGMCAMCREGDNFYPVFHHLYGNRVYQTQYVALGLTHLYQGDTEIPLTTHDGIPSFTMPSEPGDYRLTLEDPTLRTESEWTFHDDGTADQHEMPYAFFCPNEVGKRTPPNCQPEPLVYATYDLGSRLGLDNKVRAGGVHLFTINAYHAPSRAEMPDIAGVRLWYSLDDGDHWIPALTVPRGDGEYRALTIYPPYGFTSGAVSLKLQAWDEAGNTLTQTTTRAFELRPWHSRHTGPTAL